MLRMAKTVSSTTGEPSFWGYEPPLSVLSLWPLVLYNGSAVEHSSSDLLIIMLGDTHTLTKYDRRFKQLFINPSHVKIALPKYEIPSYCSILTIAVARAGLAATILLCFWWTCCHNYGTPFSFFLFLSNDSFFKLACKVVGFATFSDMYIITIGFKLLLGSSVIAQKRLFAYHILDPDPTQRCNL